MAEVIVDELKQIPPHEKSEEVIKKQQEIITALTQSEMTIHEKTEASRVRFESTMKQFQASIEKLASIRSQLSSITNRVNELKKIVSPVKDQMDDTVKTSEEAASQPTN